MMFTVHMARKHQLNITFETVLLGILLWFFSLPEIFRLLWSTLKLIHATEVAKCSFRQMVKEKKKLDRMLDEYEKEMK